jgi:hypothetical protein
MLYVYVDESGDLGFTEKSSRYYVIATAEVSNPLIAERVIKRVRKKLKKKEKSISEFKFSRSDEKIRNFVLKEAVKAEMNFSAIVLDKKMVYQYLKDKKDVLHNYLTGFLAESLSYYEDETDFRIVVDKFIMRKEKRDEFNSYLHRRLQNFCKAKIFEVIHESSEQHAGLQIADFVAGAVFQKYERQKEDYYSIIRPKMRLELRKWF